MGEMSAQPIVAVLAGGKGRRLGEVKPLAPLRGRPLISYALEAAGRSGLDVVVVAKRRSPLPPLSCELVIETETETHPLSGVLAALSHAAGRAVVALACDMPFLTAPLIAWLAARQGAAVVELDGRMQPLLARYERRQMPVLAQALREGASLHTTLDALAPSRVGERDLSRFGDPDRLCFNVNDRADLARAEELLSEEAFSSLRAGDAAGAARVGSRR